MRGEASGKRDGELLVVGVRGQVAVIHELERRLRLCLVQEPGLEARADDGLRARKLGALERKVALRGFPCRLERVLETLDRGVAWDRRARAFAEDRLERRDRLLRERDPLLQALQRMPSRRIFSRSEGDASRRSTTSTG